MPIGDVQKKVANLIVEKLKKPYDRFKAFYDCFYLREASGTENNRRNFERARASKEKNQKKWST